MPTGPRARRLPYPSASNNFPGVPYPFQKTTVVRGFADMEYPMMANDSSFDDPNFARFVAEHEILHSWFPFYMGINEQRYGFMDEGWTTAFEYMIGTECPVCHGKRLRPESLAVKVNGMSIADFT